MWLCEKHLLTKSRSNTDWNMVVLFHLSPPSLHLPPPVSVPNYSPPPPPQGKIERESHLNLSATLSKLFTSEKERREKERERETSPLSTPLGGQIDCERRHSAAGFDLALSFPKAFLRKTVHKREQLAVRVREKGGGDENDRTSQGRCSEYTTASHQPCHIDKSLWRHLTQHKGCLMSLSWRFNRNSDNWEKMSEVVKVFFHFVCV